MPTLAASSMSEEIPYHSELARKAIHLTSLLIPILAWYVEPIDCMIILMYLFIGSLLVDIGRFQSGPLGDFLRWSLSGVIRPHERGGTGLSRFTGSTWMLAAAVLCFALFPNVVAIAAMAILVICDTSAALIGRRWGRTPFGYRKKSLEGSAAFFISGLVVAFVVPGLPLAVGIAGAVAATIAEAFFVKVDDNFAVPLFAGAAMLIFL